MYNYHVTMRLHHTDAAGILFFGRIYDIINEAYEAMLNSFDINVHDVIFNMDYLMPFVHSEADYKSPLTVGDKLEVRIKAERIGSTSFTLLFRIFKDDGTEAVTARTVSVSVDKKTFSKIPLPEKLRHGLEKI